MIDTARLEATLKRLPGFERLIACDRLSAGASRETYRLQVVINGAERVIVSQLHRSPGMSLEESLHPSGKKMYSVRIIHR